MALRKARTVWFPFEAYRFSTQENEAYESRASVLVKSQSVFKRHQHASNVRDAQLSTTNSTDSSEKLVNQSAGSSSNCNSSVSTNNTQKKKSRRKKRNSSPAPQDHVEASATALHGFQFCTQMYQFAKHLADYIRLYQETCPQLMPEKSKYYICTEHNGVGCLDLLFETFCQFMGMEKLKNLPNDSGERVFCWLGKRKANEILPVLRPNHHVVNRLPLDIYLKDKQSLAHCLEINMFRKGIGYPPHKCEHHGGRLLPHQLLCPHQYAEHSFQPCLKAGCFENLQHDAKMERGIEELHHGGACPCFQARYFLPETHVFANAVQQNVFIEDIAKSAPDAQWIVKPSYLRGGRGVRVLTSAQQLRDFLKVQTGARFMWGQDYVVQRYIKEPMLTGDGRKFDIRMFLLIVVCKYAVVTLAVLASAGLSAPRLRAQGGSTLPADESG